MADMTQGPPWPARRVGDRILCGRPTPLSGGCRGEIGLIVHYDVSIDDPRVLAGILTAAAVTLEDGLVEDPHGSNIWRVSKRAKDLRARGQKVGLPAERGKRLWRTEPALPFWRACPDCRVLSEVRSDLL